MKHSYINDLDHVPTISFWFQWNCGALGLTTLGVKCCPGTYCMAKQISLRILHDFAITGFTVHGIVNRFLTKVSIKIDVSYL